VPRSRAAPLNDPAGVVQRVGTVNHADQTHYGVRILKHEQISIMSVLIVAY
jgi:hypothetical protein